MIAASLGSWLHTRKSRRYSSSDKNRGSRFSGRGGTKDLATFSSDALDSNLHYKQRDGKRRREQPSQDRHALLHPFPSLALRLGRVHKDVALAWLERGGERFPAYHGSLASGPSTTWPDNFILS